MLIHVIPFGSSSDYDDVSFLTNLFSTTFRVFAEKQKVRRRYIIYVLLVCKRVICVKRWIGRAFVPIYIASWYMQDPICSKKSRIPELLEWQVHDLQEIPFESCPIIVPKKRLEKRTTKKYPKPM